MQSDIKVHGFASAQDFQNLDFAYFCFFFPPKTTSTHRNKPVDHCGVSDKKAKKADSGSGKWG